jgi:hypothetical protein
MFAVLAMEQGIVGNTKLDTMGADWIGFIWLKTGKRGGIHKMFGNS